MAKKIQRAIAKPGGKRVRPLDAKERAFLQRLGARIKSLRVAVGMTGEELARKIGVSTPTQFHRESGKQTVPAEDLLRYANAIGVTVSELFE